jgi:hypothetical protein
VAASSVINMSGLLCRARSTVYTTSAISRSTLRR